MTFGMNECLVILRNLAWAIMYNGCLVRLFTKEADYLGRATVRSRGRPRITT
jgi:hypothetical protein